MKKEFRDWQRGCSHRMFMRRVLLEETNAGLWHTVLLLPFALPFCIARVTVGQANGKRYSTNCSFLWRGRTYAKIMKVCCLSLKDWWGGRLSWPSQHGEQAPPKWCGGAESMMCTSESGYCNQFVKWHCNLRISCYVHGHGRPWALHILSHGDSVVASHVISWAEINVIQKCLTLLKMFKMTHWSCCHSRCRAQMGPGYLPHETWKGPQTQNSFDVRINIFMLETSVPYIAPRDLLIWTGEPKIYTHKRFGNSTQIGTGRYFKSVW